jgi:hypothetical protein
MHPLLQPLFSTIHKGGAANKVISQAHDLSQEEKALEGPAFCRLKRKQILQAKKASGKFGKVCTRSLKLTKEAFVKREVLQQQALVLEQVAQGMPVGLKLPSGASSSFANEIQGSQGGADSVALVDKSKAGRGGKGVRRVCGTCHLLKHLAPHQRSGCTWGKCSEDPEKGHTCSKKGCPCYDEHKVYDI